jgi:hypothetical protein
MGRDNYLKKVIHMDGQCPTRSDKICPERIVPAIFYPNGWRRAWRLKNPGWLAAPRPGGGGLKKALFLRFCQENILDKEAPDPVFGQCLQGFRV